MTDISATTPEPVAPLSDWEMKAVAQAKLETELFTLNKGALLDALALAGVTRVVVSFDGYGDSGQIENVEVQAGDDQVAMPGAAIGGRTSVPESGGLATTGPAGGLAAMAGVGGATTIRGSCRG